MLLAARMILTTKAVQLFDVRIYQERTMGQKQFEVGKGPQQEKEQSEKGRIGCEGVLAILVFLIWIAFVIYDNM